MIINVLTYFVENFLSFLQENKTKICYRMGISGKKCIILPPETV